MSASRSRREEKVYARYRKNRQGSDCQFCAIKKGDGQFIKATKSFKLIRNIFAYSIWDGQAVEDHLMIIPKRHIDGLSELGASEAAEYVKLVGEYERAGYSSYGRHPASAIKSVVHQHTHLIKTHGRSKDFIFLLRRPFFIRLVK